MLFLMPCDLIRPLLPGIFCFNQLEFDVDGILHISIFRRMHHFLHLPGSGSSDGNSLLAYFLCIPMNFIKFGRKIGIMGNVAVVVLPSTASW